jgi:hypothetical protein
MPIILVILVSNEQSGHPKTGPLRKAQDTSRWRGSGHAVLTELMIVCKAKE